MTGRSPEQLAAAVERHCAQGERAMIHLVWTFANISWRDHLTELVALAERVEVADLRHRTDLHAVILERDRADIAEARVAELETALREIHRSTDDMPTRIVARASLAAAPSVTGPAKQAIGRPTDEPDTEERIAPTHCPSCKHSWTEHTHVGCIWETKYTKHPCGCLEVRRDW